MIRPHLLKGFTRICLLLACFLVAQAATAQSDNKKKKVKKEVKIEKPIQPKDSLRQIRDLSTLPRMKPDPGKYLSKPSEDKPVVSPEQQLVRQRVEMRSKTKVKKEKEKQ